MAISASVQFIGIDPVLNAYEARKVAPWALFMNRQFLFKYEGDDLKEGAELLATILNQLNESPAVYTLKVYEDLPGGKIREKTECDGSFNFRIVDAQGGAVGMVGGGSANYELVRLMQDIRQDQKQLAERLEMLESDEIEGEISGVNSTIGVIKEVMNIPGVGELLSGIIGRVFNPISAAPIAGIAGAPANENLPDESIELRRVLSAYSIIKEGMPDALVLLEKLAMMQQSEPDKFSKFRASIGLFI